MQIIHHLTVGRAACWTCWLMEASLAHAGSTSATKIGGTNSGRSESFLKSSRNRKAMKGSYRLFMTSIIYQYDEFSKFTYNLKMVHIISLGFCSDVKVMTFATFSLGLRWDNQSEVHSTKTKLARNSLKWTLETFWDHNQLSSCQDLFISFVWGEFFQHISTDFDLIPTAFVWPCLTSNIFRGQDFVVGSAVWRRWVVTTSGNIRNAVVTP